MLGSSLVSTETTQPYSGSTQVESTSRQSGSIWEDQFLGGQGAVLIDRRTGKALWSTAKDDSGGWADTISQLGGRGSSWWCRDGRQSSGQTTEERLGKGSKEIRRNLQSMQASCLLAGSNSPRRCDFARWEGRKTSLSGRLVHNLSRFFHRHPLRHVKNAHQPFVIANPRRCVGFRWVGQNTI